MLCTYRLAVQAGRAHRVRHVAHGRHGAPVQVSGALQEATKSGWCQGAAVLHLRANSVCTSATDFLFEFVVCLDQGNAHRPARSFSD